jgi:sucrose-phosphate synthase
MDFSTVVVPDAGDVVEGEVGSVAFSSDATNVVPVSPRVEHPIWGEIMRFFTNPHKPMILALARPDPKKNITTLLKAFGECAPLRELANLVKEKINKFTPPPFFIDSLFDLYQN